MREIKFRYIFKDEDNKLIIHYYDIEKLERGDLDWLHLPKQEWKLIDRNQYAESKDKNGKEIYGGDIVRGEGISVTTWKDDKLTSAFRDYLIGVVQYTFGAFEIDWKNYRHPDFKDMNSTLQRYTYACFDIFKIGNVYENKDLLK